MQFSKTLPQKLQFKAAIFKEIWELLVKLRGKACDLRQKLTIGKIYQTGK